MWRRPRLSGAEAANQGITPEPANQDVAEPANQDVAVLANQDVAVLANQESEAAKCPS